MLQQITSSQVRDILVGDVAHFFRVEIICTGPIVQFAATVLELDFEMCILKCALVGTDYGEYRLSKIEYEKPAVISRLFLVIEQL